MPAPVCILARTQDDATAWNAGRAALLRSTGRVDLVFAIQLNPKLFPANLKRHQRALGRCRRAVAAAARMSGG